jgi:DNA mismatch repair protein MutS
LSIAWAVAEHLHDAPGVAARTLFATHYHELTDLARTKARVVDAHFEARELGDDVVFLRRLIPGGASRSYGIQVARLAGLPTAVIARAREILANLEGGELDDRGRPRIAGPAAGSTGDADQLGLFASGTPTLLPEQARVLERLCRVQPDDTTPRDAWALLAELRAALVPPESGEGS